MPTRIKKLVIRNSTAEFLIFTSQAGEDGIEVRVADENVWLTQKLIADLFGSSKQNIGQHLKKIFEYGELDENSVVKNFFTTASDNKKYAVAYYNLEAIIAVGFRINSEKATNFRRWAGDVLKDFTIRGYALDSIRLEKKEHFSVRIF